MSFLNRRNFINLSAYFLSSLIVALISLMINPFIAARLSHTDYAIIGYYASFATLLTPLVTFSLQSFYARKYYLVDENTRKTIYDVLITLFFTIGFAVLIVFTSLYFLYHHFFADSIPLFPYAFLTFIPIWVSSFYNLYLMDLKMQGSGRKYAFISILNAVLTAMLTILLVCVWEYGAIGRLSAILISTIIVSILCLISKRVQFICDFKIIKEALSFSWPLVLSGVLSFFFIGIDRVLLEKLDDNISLGLYNVGFQISGYLAIFGTVLLQTYDPDLYKFTARMEHKKVLILCAGVVGAVLVPNLIFIACSKPIISLLTAGRYADSAMFANILCLRNVTTTFSFIMSGVLIGYGLSKYELVNRVIGSVLSVLLYYFLISHYGFYGAAWGQSISWLLMGIISLLCLFIFLKKNAKTKRYTSGL